MRTLLRILGFGLLLVFALAAGLYTVLQPPAPLALSPQGATLSDVTVIEPGGGRAEHQRVVVVGDRIESAGPGSDGGPYAGALVLPGLADLHVHFPPPSLPGQTELFAFLFLYHGVTSVRDAGDVDGTTSAAARSGVAEGRFPGPRIRSCGPFVNGEETLWKNSKIVRSPAEGRQAVQEIAAAGWECVKAYNGLDAPSLAAGGATLHTGSDAPPMRRGGSSG